MPMILNDELQDLWAASDDAATRACRSFGDENLVQTEIARLRAFYSGHNQGDSPDFASEAVQIAYSVAYHPLHAYTYFSILESWGLGDAMFKSLNQSSRILCLGSGPAAEVTALIRWFRFRHRRTSPSPVFFELVDKASWTKVRNLVADPAVKEFKRSGLVDIQTRTGDLLDQSVIDYLKTRAGRYDIVLLPSSITEMSGNSRFPALVDALRSLVDAGSRLALLDHHIPGFKSSVEPLLAGFDVESGEIPKGSITCPRPNGWLEANLFAVGSRPSRSYKFTWSVASK